MAPTDTSPLLEAHLLRDMQRGAARVRAEAAGGRIRRLRQLQTAIATFRPAVHEAFAADLGKSPQAVDSTEVLSLAMEIDHAIGHVRRWMRSSSVGGPLPFLGTRCEIRYDPKGVVLVIGAWNYPLLLTLGPLVSAIAAGCAVVVKPSEHAPRVADVMADLVASCFASDEVRVVLGDHHVSQALTEQPFDHIYFTGSTGVGRKIMRSAAANLTPVTLELGGKSPTIVDESADLERAAERIVFGKFSNAGQTCVAPDHVYVHRSRHDALVGALGKYIETHFGAEATSPHYGRIVNRHQHERLESLAEDTLTRGGHLAAGGPSRPDDRFMAPTLVTDAPMDSRAMQEEIFGPMLPVVPYDELDDVLGAMADRPRPLALYLFTASEQTKQTVLARTDSGTVVINDVLLQFANPELPFGGSGASGLGRGHGHWGFLEFTNVRSVVRQRRRWAATELVHPPFTPFKRGVIAFLLRRFGIR